MKEDLTLSMMKQFSVLKEKHPGALILFRCGDYYEAYCEDAEILAKIFGIVLTARVADRISEKLKMASFPYYALDTYLPKLVRAGKRVAICDQI